jgi:peptidoglycan biosynthesis protein MviN/MurJ (putative lipid II flippase)
VIVAALAVNVALNFALIPRYGSLGAAVSTLISFAVFCALRFWASNMFFKVRYEWGRVFTIAVVGGALLAVFYLNDYLRGDLARYSFDDPSRKAILWVSMLIKTGLALSFPLLLLGLGFFTDNERQRVGGFWRRLVLEVKRRPLKEAIGD